MEFFNDLTSTVVRQRRAADKDMDSFYKQASLDEWDADLFIQLVMRKEMANGLDQEHARTVNQALKSTMDFFQ